MDMRKDVFADQSYGKVALKKLGQVDPDFRLYKAGWLGNGDERTVMQVTGAVFREVQRGPRKGELGIMIPRTSRSVYVTAAEMREVETRTPDAAAK